MKYILIPLINLIVVLLIALVIVPLIQLFSLIWTFHLIEDEDINNFYKDLFKCEYKEIFSPEFIIKL